MMDRLLYDYDSSTNKISPLPASPLLLPAVIVMAVFSACYAIFGAFIRPKTSGTTIEKLGVPRSLFLQYREKYLRLKAIESRRPLTLAEAIELHDAEYPPWGSGCRWKYK